MENVLREIVSFYYLLLFIIGVKCIEFNSINGLWSLQISIYLCIWYPYYNNLYSVHGSIYQSDAVSVRYEENTEEERWQGKGTEEGGRPEPMPRVGAFDDLPE